MRYISQVLKAEAVSTLLPALMTTMSPVRNRKRLDNCSRYTAEAPRYFLVAPMVPLREESKIHRVEAIP